MDSDHWKTIACTAYRELVRRERVSEDEVSGLLCTAAHVAAKRESETAVALSAAREENEALRTAALRACDAWAAGEDVAEPILALRAALDGRGER